MKVWNIFRCILLNNFLKFIIGIVTKRRFDNNKESFESLIKNNKIDLAENYNFTRLYKNEKSVYELILYSIEKNNHDAINFLFKHSAFKLCAYLKFKDLIDLYINVTIKILINQK